MSGNFRCYQPRYSLGLRVKYAIFRHHTSYRSDFARYFFDENNKLISVSFILLATEELEQINQLSKSGFYKINDHVFYHKTHDVKVTIYNIRQNKQDSAIFVYSRKDYKTPD